MFSTDGAHYVVGVIVVAFVAIFAIWSEAPEILWGRSADEIAARRVVANVDGVEILRGELLDEAEARELIVDRQSADVQSAPIRELLEEVIDQKLLAAEALARDLDETEFGRRAIALARDRALGELVLEEEVGRRVTEEALRELYDEQVRSSAPNFQVRARHVLVDSEVVAKAVIARLSRGEAFEEVAMDLSLDDKTKANGGDLGFFGRGIMAPQFETVAFATQTGEISEPFETDLGWHVIKVEDRREQAMASFEELRPQLLRYLTYQSIENLIEQLRDKANIDYTLEDNVSD